MKLARKPGSTSQILQIFIRDSTKTDGSGLTGLSSTSLGLTAYYHRDTDTTATAISIVSMTVGTFTSGGFKEIDATNMPGWYQFCPPNACFAAGASSVGIHLKGATNMAPLPIEIDLSTQVDVELWNGTAVPAPATAGVPDVNAKAVNNVPATSVTTLNANLGTTQPVNFTSTGPSALVKSDSVDIGGNAAATAAIGSVGSVTSAASIATAIWQDLTSSADFTTTGSIGKLLATNIDATISSRLATSGYTAPPSAASIATTVWQDTTAGDFTVVGSIGKLLNTFTFTGSTVNAAITGNVTVGAYATNQDPATLVLGATASSWNGAGTIGAKINAASAPTAAQVATAVWQDTTAGDFTVVGSIGKLLNTFTFTGSNVNAAITGNVTVGGYATGQDPATLVLDVAASSHNTAGSIGQKINAAGGASDPLTNAVPGAYAAGTAGYVLGTYLNASVSAVKSQTDKLQFDASNFVKSDPQTAVTVSGNVTVGAYAAGEDPATLVWNALTASFSTAGSFGLLIKTDLDAQVSSRLASASYTVPPSAATIATQIFTDLLSGTDFNTAGSFGALVKANLDTNVGSRLASTSYVAPDNADIALIAGKLPVNNIADETLVISATNAILSAVGTPMQAGTVVHINTTDAIPTTGNTANSIADCLNAARAQGFGPWKIVGNNLSLYAPDGVTVVHSFTLDNGVNSTQRT